MTNKANQQSNGNQINIQNLEQSTELILTKEEFEEDLLAYLKKTLGVEEEFNKKQKKFISNLLKEKLDQLIEETKLPKMRVVCCSFEQSREVIEYLKEHATKKEFLDKLELNITFGEKMTKASSDKIAIDHRMNMVTHLINYEGKKVRSILVNAYLEDIANLYKKYGDNLFVENLRNQIKNENNVDSEVEKTLINAPEEFYFLNNGITINTCEEIRMRKGTDDRDEIILTDFSIINGAQTTTNVAKLSYEHDNIAKNIHDCKVLLRINQIFGDYERVGTRIAIGLNRQKQIKDQDIYYAHIRSELFHHKYLEDIMPIFKDKTKQYAQCVQIIIAAFKQNPIRSTINALYPYDLDDKDYVLRAEMKYDEYEKNDDIFLDVDASILFENNKLIAKDFYLILEKLVLCYSSPETEKRSSRRFYYIATFTEKKLFDKIKNNDFESAEINSYFSIEDYKAHIRTVDQVLDGKTFKKDIGINKDYIANDFMGKKAPIIYQKLRDELNKKI